MKTTTAATTTMIGKAVDARIFQTEANWMGRTIHEEDGLMRRGDIDIHTFIILSSSVPVPSTLKILFLRLLGEVPQVIFYF